MIHKYIALITTNDLNGLHLQQITPDATNTPITTSIWHVITLLFVIAIYGFLLAMLIGGVQYLFSMGGEEGIAKSKKTFVNSIIGLMIVFFSYSIIDFIIHQFGPTLTEGSFSIGGIVAQLFGIVIPLSGAGFLILLLVGGLTYLTAAGNEEGESKAKKMITSAVIGIILVAFSYGIGHAVLTLFHIL
jgi:hypothetical protein